MGRIRPKNGSKSTEIPSRAPMTTKRGSRPLPCPRRQQPAVPSPCVPWGDPLRGEAGTIPGPGQSSHTSSPADARTGVGEGHRQPSHAGPTAPPPSRHHSKPPGSLDGAATVERGAYARQWGVGGGGGWFGSGLTPRPHCRARSLNPGAPSGNGHDGVAKSRGTCQKWVKFHPNLTGKRD